MHLSLALLSLATATSASPFLKRQAPGGPYHCFVTGWTSTSNSITFGPSGSSATHGVGVAWGYHVELEDTSTGTKFQYWSPSGDTKAPNALGGIDFKPEDTKLDGTIHYDGGGDLTLKECSCHYLRESDSSDAADQVYTGVFFNEGTAQCTCDFPCAPPKPTSGFCGIHITQFQKQDPSKDNYKITVAVKDAANPPIQVGSNSYIDAPTDFHVFTQTLLGPAIEVIPGAVDDDPLRFSYNGNEWDSNNGNCKVGNYDAGIRMIDCGFDC